MTRRTTLAIAAALAALLLATGLAAAQEPPETATATRLEPGLNLVGWVGEPTPVSQLFQQIPQLEAIWAWDAELRDWIVAAPGAPEWLGGLGRVTAGMGLRMQLGGEHPFVWQRSTEPTRGLVKLRTGWNLVAWSGADGAAIGDVVKGIGWSLRTVRRWDAANQQWVTWTSPERSAQVIANTGADQSADDDADAPGIRRGEALWIEVARAVNWLQPTDILPRLVFPGGASEELQSRVREDLQATLAFFRDQYGIQADPHLTVYVAKGLPALIEALKDGGMYVRASTRDTWNRSSGWARDSKAIVVKQASWPEDLSTDEVAWARYTVTHEYFHVLQGQLSDSRPSAWLVEGTASWIDSEHAVFDGERTRDDLRDELLSAVTNDTPTLRSAESNNATWHYTLGQLATDQLIATGGPDSIVEFWHRLALTETVPPGQRESTSDWRTAFQGVFGQPVSEFYADFNAWQREQAAANPATANPYDGNWIRGRVTGTGGAPVGSVFVNAIRVEGETEVGWNQRSETDGNGIFAVRAPRRGDYRLSVEVNDDCTRYYSDGALVTDAKEAQLLKVAGADVQSTNIQMVPHVCGWQIRGHVIDADGVPFSGIMVEACGENGCTYDWALPGTTSTETDGSFVLTVQAPGVYELEFTLGRSCNHYSRYDWSQRSERLEYSTPRWQHTVPITVMNAAVDYVMVQTPTGVCTQWISGWVVDSLGATLASGWINVYPRSESFVIGVSTDVHGHFKVRVPSYRAYHFAFDRGQKCLWWFPEMLGRRDVPVRVSAADVTNIVLRLPGTLDELYCRPDTDKSTLAR